MFAAVLRFWELDAAPVWMDEGFTHFAARLPLEAILFDAIDNHPPLFYAVQHAWVALSGGAVDGLRVPAAVAGVLTVAVAIAAVGDLVSRRAGLVAGLVLALSTGAIHFSQDARMYPLLMLGLCLALWGLIGGLIGGMRGRGGAPLYVALYLLGGTVAIYAHAMALVFLLAVNLGVLAAMVIDPALRERWRWWLAVNFALGCLALPWILQFAGAARTFQGLATVDPFASNWFLRNAIGFPGLPRPFRLPAEGVLALAALAGAVLAWRAGRREIAIVALAGLGLYPLFIVILSGLTPIVATRVFLPAGLALALLLAMLVQLPRRAGALALALFAGVALWSALRDHAGRTKLENLPAALAFADAEGFGGAPVHTCQQFTASAILATAPEREIVIGLGDGLLRLDEGYYRVLRRSMAMVRGSGAVARDAALGGGYLVEGGLAGLTEGRDGVVAIVAPACEADRVARLDADLAGLGFARVAERAFRGGLGGQTIMRRGETVVRLYRR
ncbi:MAG: glycosyltransferase family 39 protein [Pseudomonadota bacterium]